MMAAPAFQWIVVEEGRAVEGEAGERAVVERLLQDVGEPAVRAAAEHAARPHGEADGSAGLGIGALVGQVVIVGKSLIARRRADAAGHVHLLFRQILPENLQRIRETVVAEFGRDIGHAGIEIHRPDRVSRHLGLLAHR